MSDCRVVADISAIILAGCFLFSMSHASAKTNILPNIDALQREETLLLDKNQPGPSRFGDGRWSADGAAFFDRKAPAAFSRPEGSERTDDHFSHGFYFTEAPVVTDGSEFNSDYLTDVSEPFGIIPEPHVWVLLVLGFGGVGWRLRRYRTRHLIIA